MECKKMIFGAHKVPKNSSWAFFSNKVAIRFYFKSRTYPNVSFATSRWGELEPRWKSPVNDRNSSRVFIWGWKFRVSRCFLQSLLTYRVCVLYKSVVLLFVYSSVYPAATLMYEKLPFLYIDHNNDQFRQVFCCFVLYKIK